MALKTTSLIPLVEPAAEVVTNVADNYTRKKISDNERAVQLDNNRLAAHQTSSNNYLAAFMGFMNTGAALINGVLSVVNTAIQAYAQIQTSREQTRQVEIRAEAYISGKREETRQVQIQQEQETVRYLANLKTDLNVKRFEFERFKLELADRQKDREFSQEQWRRRVTQLEKIVDPVIDYAQELRRRCLNSDVADEKFLTELKRLDDKLFEYAAQIHELYK